MVAPVVASAGAVSTGAGAGGGAAGGLAGSGGAGGTGMGAEMTNINTPMNLRATGGPFNQQFGQQAVNQRYYDPKAHGYQDTPDSFVRPEPSQPLFPEESEFNQFGRHGDTLPNEGEAPRTTDPPQTDSAPQTAEPDAKSPEQRQQSAAPEGRETTIDTPQAEAPDPNVRAERSAPEGRPGESQQPDTKSPAQRIEQQTPEQSPTAEPPISSQEPSPDMRRQLNEPPAPKTAGPSGPGRGKGGWGWLLFRILLSLGGGDDPNTPVHEFSIGGSKDPSETDKAEEERKKNQSRKKKGRGPGGGKGKGGGGSGRGETPGNRPTRYKLGKPDPRGRRIVTETKPGPVKPRRPNTALQRRRPSATGGGSGAGALRIAMMLAVLEALATIAQGYKALLAWEQALTAEHEGMVRFKLNQLRARRIEGTNVYINPKTGELLVIGPVDLLKDDLWEPTVIGQLQKVTEGYFRDPGTGLQVYQEQDGSWQAGVIPPGK